MKKKLLFLAVSALLWGGTATVQAEVYSGNCGVKGDNLTWTLDTKTGVLEISGTGAMKWYGYVNSEEYPDGQTGYKPPWYDYQPKITSIKIDEGVTSIGSYAFSGTAANTVTIPKSIISIGELAFLSCSKLTEVWFNADSCLNGSFGGCPVQTVHIGENVKLIPDYAFGGCSLKSVTIPESVISIGRSAFCDSDHKFDGVSFLTEVWFNADSCLSGSFEGCPLQTVHIGENVKLIPDYAFRGCSLTSVMIPESVTSIGNEAFHGCTELTGATIGSGVTVIGDGAFFGCTKLKEFNGKFSSADHQCLVINDTLRFFAPNGLLEYTIPDNVTVIDASAFHGYTSLEKITIPDNVTAIGDRAFFGCNGLMTVTIGSGVTAIGEESFSNCSKLEKFIGQFASSDNRCLVINDTLRFFAPGGLTEYTILEGIPIIGKKAFYGCSGLTSVTIPERVTAICEDAFYECENLSTVWFNAIEINNNDNDKYSFNGSWSTVHIGEKVKRIPHHVFSECNNLKEVYFNADSCINGYFERCESLATVHIGENVKRIPDSAFYRCTSLSTITIPESVISIGNKAFTACTGLKMFDGKFVEKDNRCLIVNDTLIAFAPNALTEYTISADIKAIGDGVFEDCNDLTSVTIPKSVTTIGDDAFNGCWNLKEVWFNADSCIKGDFSGCVALKTVYIGENVKSIPRWAFSYCDGLTSVTIPESVTTIGDYAFSGCENLKEVWFNADSCLRGGFSGCEALKTVHIGENVKRIPGNAFQKTGLTSVTIPESVTTIDYYAFSGTGLTEVTIPKSVISIGSGAFSYCKNLTEARFNADSCISGSFTGCPLQTVHIGENVKRIPDYAFQETSLTTVTIPENVATIGNSAFSGCKNLTEVWFNADSCIKGGFSGCEALKTVHIGENVKRIPDYAFQKTGLTSVTIPKSVITIGDWAFSGTGLTEVTIPNSVTAIGDEAFAGCDGLTSATINNTIIGNWAFEGCTGLKSVTIGNSVTTIGYGVFEDCSSLTSVTIPESVTTIGNYAFNGCTGLKKFEGKFASADNRCLIVNDTLIAFAPNALTQYTISSDVKVIGDDAFSYCDGLTSITIPESVIAIGNGAFSGCSGLKSVTVYNPTPVQTGWFLGVFNGVDYDNCTLYVPESSIEAYKAAEGWMTFKEILPINETDEPENPDVPDVPSEPENPDEPDTPDVPDVPDVPDEPENPDTPDEPIVPDEPASVTETPTDAEHITVYTLQGVPVLETNDAADLRKLSAGAYIVNGKKIIITR